MANTCYCRDGEITKPFDHWPSCPRYRSPTDDLLAEVEAQRGRLRIHEIVQWGSEEPIQRRVEEPDD